ncbi:MAG TPA: polysaccharide biosynthesis/export family protein [Bacteroidales bacterium]|nr:polysaccharide biosynthesis/export family protein [Bacteroidales bacterium]
MAIRFLFPVLLAIASASCAPHRNLAYLQRPAQIDDTVSFNVPAYRLKPGDILHLRVTTLDQQTRQLFITETTQGNFGATAPNAQFFLSGYTINSEGYIEIPVVGSVAVGGLDLEEANEVVRQKIGQYLTDATVSVKLVNFSVTVLGEVKNPGQFFVFDNSITVMDAIGLAGDLTDFGNREIHIIRRGSDGVQFNTIDITSRQAASSEYFFLHPGDLVYVEPMRIKRLGFDTFPFAAIFSAISTTLLLLNFFERN